MRAGGPSCLLMLSQGRCCLSDKGKGSHKRRYEKSLTGPSVCLSAPMPSEALGRQLVQVDA